MDQILFQFMGVVELPIVYNSEGMTIYSPKHGLVAAAEVDDGQAHMGQTEVGGQKGTGFIRTTVLLHKVHLLQDGAVSGAFF